MDLIGSRGNGDESVAYAGLLYLPLFSTKAPKPSPETSSITLTKLQKDDVIVSASGKCI
jgi:hypothetical protein